MSKRPQERFRRLAIVGRTDKKAQHQPAIHAPFMAKSHLKSLRMAVMPTLSRGMWLEGLAWIGDFLRSYFVAGRVRRQSAVVLSFRSHAARAHGFRVGVADEASVSKKFSRSVRWNHDRDVAPQEGGRG